MAVNPNEVATIVIDNVEYTTWETVMVQHRWMEMPGVALQIVSFRGFFSAAMTVISMSGGTDTETDDELRVRLLDRLSAPPMGGDAEDYVVWALSVPGVTRAWSAPNEMGIGTVTVRFMHDLRASTGGFPNQDDMLTARRRFLISVRPVKAQGFPCRSCRSRRLSISPSAILILTIRM